ncbi:MAG TPA: choice-of-anchor tandem repeat GloVer-containing protein [Rhizomicrobium sp.]|nr:choice-of-anchor tandem repeat GloVer-containing protein [Rhizomicrobium sp.]
MKALPLLVALACTTPAFAAPQYSAIYTFLGDKDGRLPASLTLGPDGALYGTTAAGGAKDDGTIYKLSPPATPDAAWTKETIYEFKPNEPDGPSSNIEFDQDTGALLGTINQWLSTPGSIYRLVPPAGGTGKWKYTTVYAFEGGADGETANGTIGQDPATGTLYGATYGDPIDGDSFGTIYGFTPDAARTRWTRTFDYAFSGPDGQGPGGVTIGPNGILYGVTWEGGAGFGTIFALDPATGARATLFEPQSADERYIFQGPPIFSDDGATMYATSSSGDQARCDEDRLYACGAVISMPTDGSAPPTVLMRFVGKRSAEPSGKLIWNKARTAFYGSAYLGLPNICRYENRKYSCGTVFKFVRKNGAWKYKLIHAFTGPDGQTPRDIALGPDGTLYGVAVNGGANKSGLVFQIVDP